MTAYLQPGDSIHLAIPMTVKLAGPDMEETTRLANELTAFYNSKGIHVAKCTAGPITTHPQVIAVFRRAAAEQEASNQ